MFRHFIPGELQVPSPTPLRMKLNLARVGTRSSNTGQTQFLHHSVRPAPSFLVCACVLMVVFYDSAQCI